MNNAGPPCITATAGTKFVRTSYFDLFIVHTDEKSFTVITFFISPTKYSWIDLSTIVQIFSTADPRKSLDLVSVLMWLNDLSAQLWIINLVGRYPTNYLIQ